MNDTERLARALDALAELLRSGEHEGQCKNFPEQPDCPHEGDHDVELKDCHYDLWDSCYRHIEASERRRAAARGVLAALRPQERQQ